MSDHRLSGITITRYFLLLLLASMAGCSDDGGSSTLDDSTGGQGYGSGDHEFFMAHGGIERKYRVYAPPSYDKNRTTPVVMYIHGGGGNVEAAYLDKLDEASDKHGFILAIPEGTGEIKNGKFKASWNGGVWETGKCCGKADDVGFISMMIDTLAKDFTVDKNRIYAVGISNGGLMTNRLGCELSNKITAIATVAPAAIMSGCNPTRAVPFMNIHGTGDTCNDYYTGQASFSFCANVDYTRMTSSAVVAAWKNNNNCTEEYIQGYYNGDASCIIYKNCDGNTTVEFCTVERMGHTWPSGSQYLPAEWIGPVSYDISTDQIWVFFQKYSL